MQDALRRLLVEHGGVVSRRQALDVVPHHVHDRAVSGGRLVRILPRTYVHPGRAGEVGVWRRAATVYLAGSGALSHVTDSSAGGCRCPSRPPYTS